MRLKNLLNVYKNRMMKLAKEVLQSISEGELDQAIAIKQKEINEYENQPQPNQQELSEKYADLALLEAFTQPQKSLEHLQEAVKLDGENIRVSKSTRLTAITIRQPHCCNDVFSKGKRVS